MIDLDPGEGLPWEAVVETASSASCWRRRNSTWPKLTGGKGIHVMAPLPKPMLHDKRIAMRCGSSGDSSNAIRITTFFLRRKSARSDFSRLSPEWPRHHCDQYLFAGARDGFPSPLPSRGHALKPASRPMPLQ